jgi:hypothetical protein
MTYEQEKHNMILIM